LTQSLCKIMDLTAYVLKLKPYVQHQQLPVVIPLSKHYKNK